MENTNTLSFDSPELSMSEYRALRDGNEVTKQANPDTGSTPAAEAAPAAEAEGVEKPTNETPQEKKTEDKDGLKLRFSELTGEIKQLKAQLAERNNGASGSAAKPAEVTPAAAAPSTSEDPEPDPAKYEDYTKWQKDWMRWDRRQETKAEAARTAEAAGKAAAKTHADAWQERVKAAAASDEMKDFEAVAQNKDLPVTQVMARAITESEIGPEVLYHLGKNIAEAERISKLSQVAQVREIGKIEARLEAAKAAKASESQDEQPVAVSKAPKPVAPVRSAAASTNPAKNIDSMSQADYRTLRESGKIR